MPELRNILVAGGGLAGMAAAYWAAGQRAGGKVILLEKSGTLMGGYPASLREPVPVASRASPGASPCLRGGIEGERLLKAWPGAETCDWLRSIGLPLVETETGTCLVADVAAFRERFSAILERKGVQIITGYPVETITVGPDGRFRIWSRDGMPLEGTSLLLATGGERNHGMKLARELGPEVELPQPAFIRLRLAGGKFAERMGPLQTEVRLQCEKTGMEASGMVTLSARGLEGPALSALSARSAKVWEQLGWTLRLRVDWLPRMNGSAIRNELQSRAERGGRRSIGISPLFGFSARQWNAFLETVRIDPEDSWSRLKPRRLQGLMQLLKGQSLAFKGMGLPAGERAWSGGVDPRCLDASCQATNLPGLYFAGEILDVLGLPEGPHCNLAWASAHVAGSSMGSRST